MNSFEADKKRGKIGEAAVQEYFEKIGKKVINVSENKFYQSMDIDFLIDEEAAEVKTQSSLSRGFITLELDTIYNNCFSKKGWFYSSEAIFFLFYDSTNNLLYKIDTAELRDYVSKNFDTLKFHQYKFDEGYKVSELLYVPLNELLKNLYSFSIIELN